MRKMTWLALALAITGSTVAVAQISAPSNLQLPTDVDLKASYCLGYYKSINEIVDARIVAGTPNFLSKEDTARQHQMNIASENRLRLYLLPRLPYLDPMGIVLAMGKGRQDVQSLQSASEQCLRQCSSAACYFKCLETVPQSAATNSCFTLDFLPY